MTFVSFVLNKKTFLRIYSNKLIYSFIQENFGETGNYAEQLKTERKVA